MSGVPAAVLDAEHGVLAGFEAMAARRTRPPDTLEAIIEALAARCPRSTAVFSATLARRR